MYLNTFLYFFSILIVENKNAYSYVFVFYEQMNNSRKLILINV